jgi:hypothetical protein
VQLWHDHLGLTSVLERVVRPEHPESRRRERRKAFTGFWSSGLEEQLVGRSEFETLEQTRWESATYIDRYDHRLDAGLIAGRRPRSDRSARMDND